MSTFISEVGREYQVAIYNWEESPLGIGLETNRGNAFLYPIPDVYLQKASMVRDVYQKMGKTKLILPVIPNKDGEEIVQIGNASYYLTAWPKDEADLIDYAYLGETLANFHLVTGKKIGSLQSKYKGCGTWHKDWSSRVNKLARYRKNAIQRLERQEAHDFDSFFVDNYDHFQYLGAKAVKYLQDVNYHDAVKKSGDKGILSYNQFGFDQFVSTPQRQLYFVDSFSWVEDMRARDIAQFIKADVREYGWNPYHIHAFLTAYHAKSPLFPEEFGVMYANFILPGRVLKKLESLNPPKPSLFTQPGVEEMENMDEMETYTPVVAYQELLRNDVLVREFPRFVKNVFRVNVPKL